MALYIKVGREGINKIVRGGTHNEIVIICDKISDLEFDRKDKSISIGEKGYTFCKYRIYFESSDSLDKFLQNRFSNMSQRDEIERLESRFDKLEAKIDELKELIYFSVNGPGFQDAEKDYAEQQEKIEKE